jgi:hypothetical protein
MEIEQPANQKTAFTSPVESPIAQEKSSKIGVSKNKTNGLETSQPEFLYKRLNLQILGFNPPLVSLLCLNSLVYEPIVLTGLLCAELTLLEFRFDESIAYKFSISGL